MEAPNLHTPEEQNQTKCTTISIFNEIKSLIFFQIKPRVTIFYEYTLTLHD